MYKLRRKLLSQNFLRNRRLVEQLVAGSSIGKNDLVLEIGPGKGIITECLVRSSQQVIAVELDTSLYKYNQEKFVDIENLTIYLGDILSFELPRLPYKVFANIPFAIEGKVIRKLLNDSNPPSDCYLVMMKSVAERLAGIPKDNLFALSYKPFFDFEIYHEFSRFDFKPTPNVDSVLLRFTKRREPFIPLSEKIRYQRFLERGFGNGLPVKRNLQKFYGRGKVEKVLTNLGINKQTKPSFVTLQQWILLYNRLK